MKTKSVTMNSGGSARVNLSRELGTSLIDHGRREKKTRRLFSDRFNAVLRTNTVQAYDILHIDNAGASIYNRVE